MLKIEKISKIYKGKTDGDEALSSLSLECGDNGLLFVLGASGSGKSTLLNVLGLLDYPTTGDISFNGISYSSLNEAERCQFRNENIGFVFQGYNLVSNYTVYENLKLAMDINGQRDYKTKIKAVLESVGLANYEKRKMNELSGGQKQRIAIARALLKNPKMLLCDEPTGALDSRNSNMVLELLKKLSKDILVIVVSHDYKLCDKYADRVILIENGIAKEENHHKIESKNEVIELKRPKAMPIFSKLNVTRKMLAGKPITLIFAIIFLCINLAGLILLFSISNVNKNAILSHSNTNAQYVTLHEKSESVSAETTYLNMDDEDIEFLKGQGISGVYPIYDHFKCRISNYRVPGLTEVKEIYGFTEVSQKMLDDTGMKLLAGRLPENDEEACIPEFLYQSFKKAGYGRFSSGAKVEKYEDLLGKILYLEDPYYITRVGDFKICGIIETNFDYKLYNEILNDFFEGDSSGIVNLYDEPITKDDPHYHYFNGIHKSAFMKEGFYERNFKNVDTNIYRGLGTYADRDYLSSLPFEVIPLEKNSDSNINVIVNVDCWMHVFKLRELLNKYRYDYAFKHYEEIKEQFEADNGESHYDGVTAYKIYLENCKKDKYTGIEESYFYKQAIEEVLRTNHSEGYSISLGYGKSLEVNIEGFYIYDKIKETRPEIFAPCHYIDTEGMQWFREVEKPYFEKISEAIVSKKDFSAVGNAMEAEFLDDSTTPSGIAESLHSYTMLTPEAMDYYKVERFFTGFNNVFGVLASLSILITFLFMQYIYIDSIYRESKTYGTICSLGARRRDSIHIFSFWTSFIMLAAIPLGIILGNYIIGFTNSYLVKSYDVITSYVSLNPIIALIPSLILFMLSGLAMIRPIVILSREKPIKLLKNKR